MISDNSRAPQHLGGAILREVERLRSNPDAHEALREVATTISDMTFEQKHALLAIIENAIRREVRISLRENRF